MQHQPAAAPVASLNHAIVAAKERCPALFRRACLPFRSPEKNRAALPLRG